MYVDENEIKNRTIPNLKAESELAKILAHKTEKDYFFNNMW